MKSVPIHPPQFSRLVALPGQTENATAMVDGVHPSATGDNLLANLIVNGIFRAMDKKQ